MSKFYVAHDTERLQDVRLTQDRETLEEAQADMETLIKQQPDLEQSVFIIEVRHFYY